MADEANIPTFSIHVDDLVVYQGLSYEEMRKCVYDIHQEWWVEAGQPLDSRWPAAPADELAWERLDDRRRAVPVPDDKHKLIVEADPTPDTEQERGICNGTGRIPDDHSEGAAGQRCPGCPDCTEQERVCPTCESRSRNLRWHRAGVPCSDPWHGATPEPHSEGDVRCPDPLHLSEQEPHSEGGERWIIYVSEQSGQVMAAGFAGQDGIREVEVVPASELEHERRIHDFDVSVALPEAMEFAESQERRADAAEAEVERLRDKLREAIKWYEQRARRNSSLVTADAYRAAASHLQSILDSGEER